MESITSNEILKLTKESNSHIQIKEEINYIKHKVSSFTLLKLNLRKIGFVDGVHFKHEFKKFYLLFKDRQNIEVKKKDTLFIGNDNNMIWMEGLQTNGKYRNI